MKVLLGNVKKGLHNQHKNRPGNRSFLGSEIVHHATAFTPVEEEEVPMWRVSLGNSLRKDRDPVSRCLSPQKLWEWLRQSPSHHDGGSAFRSSRSPRKTSRKQLQSVSSASSSSSEGKRVSCLPVKSELSAPTSPHLLCAVVSLAWARDACS